MGYSGYFVNRRAQCAQTFWSLAGLHESVSSSESAQQFRYPSGFFPKSLLSFFSNFLGATFGRRRAAIFRGREAQGHASDVANVRRRNRLCLRSGRWSARTRTWVSSRQILWANTAPKAAGASRAPRCPQRSCSLGTCSDRRSERPTGSTRSTFSSSRSSCTCSPCSALRPPASFASGISFTFPENA